MELTLKRLLEHAEFKKYRGKGYDPTEVDDFLDRAAAMAGKVEVQLTAALDKAKQADGGAPAVSEADIDAEVERRLAAHIAALPAPSAGPTEDEAAEEVRRTLILAQRTADGAVREAQEDADRIRTTATEQAETMVAEAEARAAKLDHDSTARAEALDTMTVERAEASRAEVEAEAARERREARQRLAAEIAELEGLRESLRSDVNVLERHVEEQRSQLGSTLAELQQILDDPSGFRMAPAPALIEPELPDFSDLDEPEPEVQPLVGSATEPDTAEAEAEAEAEADEDEVEELDADEDVDVDVDADEAPEAEAAAEPEDAPEADVEPVELGTTTTEAAADHDDFALDHKAEEIPRPASLTFDEVDHAAPGLDDAVDEGPPTAPISVVDLDGPAVGSPAPGDGDDAFLAELRKAMADDEPLGPRDHVAPPSDTLFEDDDRRGWRFGRRH